MTEKNNKKKQRLQNGLRFAILLIILIASTAIGIIHQLPGSVKVASVDALCPFGGLESLVYLVSSGKFIERIALSSFILLIAVIVSAVVFRRTFCGYICPLGTLQEIAVRIRRLFRKKSFEIPAVADKPLRYLKYVMLVVFLGLTYAFGFLVIRPYDPWVAYHHILSTELFTGLIVGFIILVLSMVGSFFYDRVFCKYLCPMGAFLGIFRWFGLFKVKRNAATCTNCMSCNKACPVNIPVQSLETVKTAECLNCNLCVNACPEKDTLIIEGPRGIRSGVGFQLVFTILVFAVVVGLTSFTGDFAWKTQGITETTEKTGTFDSASIKGSDTFEAVSAASGVVKEEFMTKFGLTEEQYKGAIKDWAHDPKAAQPHEAQEVRDFVKAKLGN
jgi:polyferredoxin